jgi:hypothetical protein
MYVLGGKRNTDLLIYDCVENKWEVIANVIPKNRTNANMAHLAQQQQLIVLGGIVNWESVGHVDVICPKTSTMKTEAFPALPSARSWHSVAVVHVAENDDRVVVIGGYEGDYVPTIETLFVQSKEWKTSTQKLEIRNACAAVIYP